MRLEKYLIEAKVNNDPLVQYALETYPDMFKVDTGLKTGKSERNAYYYVSKGQKGVYYTLRMNFAETMWGKDELGRPVALGAAIRDYLVITLGPNPKKAIERIVKEKPKYGYKTIHISATKLNPKSKARPSDEIKFGTHQGKSVYQVADEFPDYVLWLYRQPFVRSGKSKSLWPHIQTIAIKNEKVKQLINQYEKELEQKELEKKKKDKKKEKEEANLLTKEWIGEVGERVKGVKVEVLRKHEFENQWGWSAVTIMKDSNGNMIKHFGTNKLDKGDKKKVDFTVKKHDHEQVNQYNKVPYKVTLVTRIKS